MGRARLAGETSDLYAPRATFCIAAKARHARPCYAKCETQKNAADDAGACFGRMARLVSSEGGGTVNTIDNLSKGDIREDFVPKEAFISPEFAQRERDRLWPRVWQIACREEELPTVGSFVTYEIAGESIVLVRTALNQIKSFYNVCQHRGRILMEPQSGRTKFIFCRYHGWRWDLDGTLRKIPDEHNWQGCPTFNRADLALKETLVDSWGGFVFINMDLDAEPLQDFLDPVPSFLDAFEFHKWRYRWYKSVILPCNWKTALEGFNEAYHVAATHPQLLAEGGDDMTAARTYGRHGMYYYLPEARPLGTPSRRTAREMPADSRQGLVNFYRLMDKTLNALFTERAVESVERVLTEVPEGSDPLDVMVAAQRFHREAAEADGSGWPPLTIEQQIAAGTNWHIFPNHVFLQMADGSIAYRARPFGKDPDQCVFDVWSLARFAPGEEPPLHREFYPEWTDETERNFGKILKQDFGNFLYVQKGMHSRGFAGSRTNPVQEAEIPNMHRALYDFIFDDEKQPAGIAGAGKG